jgi:hypothetical protein
LSTFAAPPTTSNLFSLLLSRGRTPSFLRSTMDFRAASRASCLCSSQAVTRSASSGSTNGSSKSPIRNFARRTRLTASSTTSIGISPCFTAHSSASP